MKTLTIIVAVFIIFQSCSKSESGSRTHINCDGLVTDTAGTSDHGRIDMPSAFTPNSDGLNDGIRPYFSNITSFTFTIYDENNTVVFTSDQIAEWRPSGTTNFEKFYYKIQATTIANHQIGKCGNLYKLSCYPGSVPADEIYFADQLSLNGFTGFTSEQLQACP